MASLPAWHYARRAMGQPVTVIEKPSQREGIVRFDTNRVLSGMDHELYTALPDPLADRPVDDLARLLFETGRVSMVHINANVITVQLTEGDAAGLRELIEDMFLYYREGVPVPSPADFEDPETETEPAAS